MNDERDSNNEEKSSTLKTDDITTTGKEKIAILFASLGIDLASKILQNLELSESVATGIFEQVASMERIPPKKVKGIIRESVQYLKGAPSLENIKAGPNYARTLLTASFGDKKSREMLRRMSESSDVLRRISKEGSGIFKFIGEEYVKDMIAILKDEHPQTVALILGHIDREIAGKILTELPSEMQHNVIKRLSKIKVVDLETIHEIEEMLKQKLGIEEGQKRGKFYGVESAADVLSTSKKETQDKILEQLNQEDPELSYELERELFRFETLSRLSDKELLKILQKVEPATIAYAIRGVSENLKNKIFKNLPQRRQELVNEEIQTMPDRVLVREVEEAQRSIIEVAQEMADKGEITLVFDESEYI